jgi:hypothetical protein
VSTGGSTESNVESFEAFVTIYLSITNYLSKCVYFSSGALYSFRHFGGIRSCIEFAAICVSSGDEQCISFSMASDIL